MKNNRCNNEAERSKPHEIVGAGELTATVWKDGDELQGWRYRFNIFRQRRTGVVSQLYRPQDVPRLVRLCHVLAATLAQDGCLAVPDRRMLVELAAQLETITCK